MKFLLLLLGAGLCCNNSLAFPEQKTVRKCGVPAVKPDTSTNIVGGKDAIPYSWPWQISIFEDGEHNCGATLITSEWVMTAAHCVSEKNPGLYTIKLGVFNNSRIDEDGEIISNVTEVHRHPDFDYGKLINDIALMKLANPVEFTDHISPVCLPTNQDEELPRAGTNLFTTGWGRVNASTYEFPTSLKQVMLPLMSTETCKAKNNVNPIFDEKLHICAGFDQGGKGICHGDSGGPAMYQTEDGSWIQIGINCFVQMGRCASPSGSGYTKVSAMMDYVKKYVKDLP